MGSVRAVDMEGDGVEAHDVGFGLGPSYQAGLDREHRHRSGIFYTPAVLAVGLVRVALDDWPSARETMCICDPSCGGGSFLIAVAEELERRFGLPRPEIATRLWGADLDPGAVEVARAEVRRWVGPQVPRRRAALAEVLAAQVVVGDSLVAGSAVWGQASPFDLVVGNPPFQSQLARSTTREAGYTTAVGSRLGIDAGAYTDTAALFLPSGLDLVRPGGRVVLIQPQSILATRDAAPVRRAVLDRGTLTGLWADDGAHFDAAVQVCAVVVDRVADASGSDAPSPADASTATGASTTPNPVRRWSGPDVASAPTFAGSLAGTWAPLLAGLRGVPDVDLHAGPAPEGRPGGAGSAGRGGAPVVVGSVASVAAGFRQHFYGLVPFVGEAGDGDVGPVRDDDGHDGGGGDEDRANDRPPDAPGRARSSMRLITSGLIDPANERWGRTTTRFGGRRFDRPVVDVVALAEADPEVADWGASLAGPKLLLATQTKVLEVIADRDGSRWPSVPVIAVCAAEHDLSRLAAVLLAPAVSAWAMTNFAGAALSADAVKLSAAQVRSIPLPRRDHAAWDDAAGAFEAAERCAARGDGYGWSAQVDRLGRAMTRAYGTADEVYTWWRARRPPFRA